MTYILIHSGRRIFKNLYVNKEQAISGKISRDQVYDPTNIRLENISNPGVDRHQT